MPKIIQITPELTKKCTRCGEDRPENKFKSYKYARKLKGDMAHTRLNVCRECSNS